MEKLMECVNFIDKIDKKNCEVLSSFNSIFHKYNEYAAIQKNNCSSVIFCDLMEKYISKKEYIIDNYIEQWNSTFNIFKIISPMYRYEKLHSRIISSIFNPATPEISKPEIYNTNYLDIFIRLLMQKEKKIKYHDFGDKYEVELEVPIQIDDKGSIDILIHDKTHAIIIENKANNAGDTDNQLAKYYHHVTDVMKKDIVALVYLPLNPDKKPLLENYYNGYEEYVPSIINVLVIIPIISNDGKEDFVHGFIDKCCRLARNLNNQIALTFFEQYNKLLKYLGGNFMAYGNEKELFAEFFKTKKSISIVNDIVEIINNKSLYIKALFCDSFLDKLKKIGFESYAENSQMRIKITDDIYLAFYHWEDEDLLFGFCSDKEIPAKTITILENILNDKDYIEHFSDIKTKEYPTWVAKPINILDLGDVPISEIIDFFTTLLLEKYIKIKDVAQKQFNKKSKNAASNGL